MGQEGCSGDARALGRKGPAGGVGLVFRAREALWSPSMLFEGKKPGFLEPCENQPTSLALSFPPLRKGVGWDDFKGIFEAKVAMVSASVD